MRHPRDQLAQRREFFRLYQLSLRRLQGEMRALQFGISALQFAHRSPHRDKPRVAPIAIVQRADIPRHRNRLARFALQRNLPIVVFLHRRLQ